MQLAPTPPANAFVYEAELGVDQELFPLDLYFCEDCAHLQRLDLLDPWVLFEHYVYVSGTSPVFVKHFEDYAAFVMDSYKPNPGGLVLEFGSNDGTLLDFFQKSGMRVLGVDPARSISEDATARGIETICGLFGKELGEDILATRGKAEVICANNVFAHIDDLAGVVDGIRNLLTPSGVFVFEVSYLGDVVRNILFDTIYHEGLDYHSVKPLVRFFAAHGLEFIDVLPVPTHGGSIRCVAQLAGGPHAVQPSVAASIADEEAMCLDRAETFRSFARNIDALGAELRRLLNGLKADGKRIAGYGAPAKATTFLYHFRIGPDLIDFIVEDNPLKQGMYTPGKHIPLVPPSVLADAKPDYILILAWNFADAIIEKHASYRQAGGRFIIPIPAVREV
ncbi:SAM-dependent methyltransferase [Paramagnetospirillum kuznetsovii]|uniref:SAM-dependent methyltransferase n=2 Tax=Paramagnetospirillum kuznetsovii TaxID=2053833 RepID=A0A364NZA4_9PROT|nr:SAM-dependent methyltransferase [Paramagnetospirillum kuznetsovii]